jgi:hypothetical protein
MIFPKSSYDIMRVVLKGTAPNYINIFNEKKVFNKVKKQYVYFSTAKIFKQSSHSFPSVLIGERFQNPVSRHFMEVYILDNFTNSTFAIPVTSTILLTLTFDLPLSNH